jgi:hypothetical protein
MPPTSWTVATMAEAMKDWDWQDYAAGARELKSAKTVDEVIAICLKHFGKSSGPAFFPGGSGDEELLSLLTDAGWRPAWVRASYYFGIYEPDGFPDKDKALHYVEGDIYRGKGRPL